MSLDENHPMFGEAEKLLRSGDRDKIETALGIYEEMTRQHQHDPKSWFERAGAYDYLGKEEFAITFYEDVLRLGPDKLPPEDRPRFYLQVGSTLRNLRRYDESRRLLEEGRSQFPGFAALRAFLALTEYTDGNFKKAAALLLDCTLDGDSDGSIKEYSRALKGYRDQIDTYPEPPIRNGSVDHVELYVSDLERSYHFWSIFLKNVGYADFQSWGGGWSGGRSLKRDDSYVVLVQADGKYLQNQYHRKAVGLNHLAFRARSQSEVDRVTETMRKEGFEPLYGDRHPRAGGNGTYALFLEDPDRIKVELVCK